MAKQADAPLDDLMMAMDVVDTLRHEETLVLKELDTEDRDRRMVERLREVYAAQGIEVPDHILKSGVEGLKEDRFVYAPPGSGFQRTLALAYIHRSVWSKWFAAVCVALVLAGAGWHFLVTVPREQAAQALQVELAQTLPARLSALTDRVSSLTSSEDALTRARTLGDDGRAAAAEGNADAARQAVAALEDLATTLAAEFEIHIVSRPGTPTGVTRIPDVNRSTQNYYLIVEALDRDGNTLTRRIVSEEDGTAEEISMWGQRVSSALFDRVRQDKQDDGIVQDTHIGRKTRGETGVDWQNGVQEGAITTW